MSNKMMVDRIKEDIGHNLDWLERRLDVVFAGLKFLATDDPSYNALGAFLQSQLVEYKGRIDQLNGLTESLYTYANPDAPEDLPF